MTREELRLADMLEAANKIIQRSALGKAAFDKDEMLQVWMVYHLQIIGEAATMLGRTYHDRNPGIPWAKIVGMRNVLVHDYMRISMAEVWQTVDKDIPVILEWLKDKLGEMCRIKGFKSSEI